MDADFACMHFAHTCIDIHYTRTHITHIMHGHTHAQRSIKGTEEMAQWVEHSLCKCGPLSLESPEPCEAGWVTHTSNSKASVVIWGQR